MDGGGEPGGGPAESEPPPRVTERDPAARVGECLRARRTVVAGGVRAEERISQPLGLEAERVVALLTADQVTPGGMDASSRGVGTPDLRLGPALGVHVPCAVLRPEEGDREPDAAAGFAIRVEALPHRQSRQHQLLLEEV